MTKKEKVKAILADKRLRIPFLKRDLHRFAKYYFPHLFPSRSPAFHRQWAKAYDGDKNVLNIGFRWSAKTTWLMAKYAKAIAYRERRFITHYCSEGSKSEAFLFDLVVQLQTNRRFTDDFGLLFPNASNGKKKQKAGVSEFITTNEVRVKAMSVGQSPRGLVYVGSDGAHRPDLAGLDDIDTFRTVTNGKMVDKNFSFVNNEIIGGLQNGSQIIFLGNVIKFDGVVPRFEQSHKDDPDWIIFRQPVLKPDWEPVWPERYCLTDDEAEETGKISLEAKRRAEGSTSYAQNYLLVPASEWDTVIRRESIRYGRLEDVKTIVIGVDPAFSSNSLSDAFAIGVVGHATDGSRNVRASYALNGKAKEYASAVEFVAKLYRDVGANVVHFESVAGQTVLAQMLRSKGVATKEVRPHADKVTRLMEYQSDIESGKITFDQDGTGIRELVEEMCEMPNGLHDDRTDAMMYALMPFRKFDVYFW